MTQQNEARGTGGSARRILSAALAVVALCHSLVLLTDTGGVQPWATGVAHAAEAQEITIKNYRFLPLTLSVPVGTTVTWVNRDSDVHKVTSDNTPPTFKSPGLDTDATFAFTFNKAGAYSYHCSLHPQMTGRIIVR